MFIFLSYLKGSIASGAQIQYKKLTFHLKSLQMPVIKPSQYTRTTHDICVEVEPMFLEADSNPDDNKYFWAYTVGISNQGDAPVQLRMRHWVITDQLGRIQEVKGVGVVGEEPVIDPNSAFQYTSGVPLSTPSGMMTGTYELETHTGERFLIQIPLFLLDSPYAPEDVVH